MYFSINRGSRNDEVLETLAELQPDTDVFAEVSISAMQDNERAADEFSSWLDSIGL